MLVLQMLSLCLETLIRFIILKYASTYLFFPLGYLLTVTARDGGVPSLSDTTDVEISVVDVNDNAPVFKQQLYTAAIMEDALVGEYEH